MNFEAKCVEKWTERDDKVALLHALTFDALTLVVFHRTHLLCELLERVHKNPSQILFASNLSKN